MKKTIIATALLVFLASPVAFAQTVSQATLQQTYNSTLQLVINLLIQEVAQLETQLAALQASQGPIAKSNIQALPSGGEISATSTQSPTIVQQLQNIAPSLTSPVGQTQPDPGTATAVSPTCSNKVNLGVWWQDPCTGAVGVYGSSTQPITYDYPAAIDPVTHQLSLIDQKVGQIVESCLKLGTAIPSGQVTFSNNNGTVLMTMDTSVQSYFDSLGWIPSSSDYGAYFTPSGYNLPTSFPAQCNGYKGFYIQ